MSDDAEKGLKICFHIIWQDRSSGGW